MTAEHVIDGGDRLVQHTRPPAALRCAVIGLGLAGSQADDASDRAAAMRSHAAAVLDHPALELAAGCDVVAAQRVRFAAARSGTAVYSCPKEMFAAEPLDCVIIATPAGAHAENCMAAVSAGVRAVFCEKPFVRDSDVGAAVLQACGNAGVVLAVNHWMRWSPLYRNVRRFIHEQRLGRVHSIRVHYSKGVLNSGSHAVDLLRFVAGEVSGVRAVQRVALQSPEGDDNYAAVLETESCPAALLTVGDHRDHFTFELDVVGAQGRLLVTDEAVRYWEVSEGRRAPDVRSLTPADCPFPTELGTPLAAALDDIVGCVASGSRSVACTGADGLRTVTIIDAIRRSWAGGGERLSV